jgi:hypothetical protein
VRVGVLVGVGVDVGVFVDLGVGEAVFVGVEVAVGAWAVWVAMMLSAIACALRSVSEGLQATKMIQITKNNNVLMTFLFIFFHLAALNHPTSAYYNFAVNLLIRYPTQRANLADPQSSASQQIETG